MIDVIFKQNDELYVCSFHSVGFTYAECRVYKQIKLLGLIPWKIYQYSSSEGFGCGWYTARWEAVIKAKPDELISWANNVFTEFWAYKIAWDKHHEHNEKFISRE